MEDLELYTDVAMGLEQEPPTTRICTCSNGLPCGLLREFRDNLRDFPSGQQALEMRYGGGGVPPMPCNFRACVINDYGVITCADAGEVGSQQQSGVSSSCDGLAHLAEVGVITNPDYQKQGYAKQALIALCQLLAKQGFDGVVVQISPNNNAAIRMARKHGAVRCQSESDRADFFIYTLPFAALRFLTE